MPTLLANQIQNSSNGRPWRCSWPIGLMPFISIDQTRSLSGCVVLLICLCSYPRMNICKRDDDEKNNGECDSILLYFRLVNFFFFEPSNTSYCSHLDMLQVARTSVSGSRRQESPRVRGGRSQPRWDMRSLLRPRLYAGEPARSHHPPAVPV